MNDTTTAALPALPPATEPLLMDRHPAAVYLASLADGPGRASMRSTLANVAAMLGTTIEACPWHALRFAHVAALRAALAERFAPATTNKYLSAIRQVMRQAWLLGLMAGEDYQRGAAVRNVKGSRLPTGRALEGGEIRALFAACADGTPAGARDAAAFALMFGMGMRRAEVATGRLRSRLRHVARDRERRQGTHGLRHRRRKGRPRCLAGRSRNGCRSATRARHEVRHRAGWQGYDGAGPHVPAQAPRQAGSHRRLFPARPSENVRIECAGSQGGPRDGAGSRRTRQPDHHRPL